MLRSLALFMVFASGPALAGEIDCGDPFTDGPEPWDYRDPEARNHPHKIPTVEKHHFTPQVENLVKGESVAAASGDIGFTLKYIPNHPRALYAISRIQLRDGVKALKSRWSAECYFDRAMRFAPDDAVVRILYGIHWAMRDQHGKAIQAYEVAYAMSPESPELLYNYGLSLFALGQYEKARFMAMNAYERGYPLPGLRRKLEEKGYGWSPGDESRMDEGNAQVSSKSPD